MINTDEIEARVAASLKAVEVPYEVIACDPESADTAVFCERYGYRLEDSGNTIVVASKRGAKKYSACVVRGSDRLDVNRTVRKLMGVSARLLRLGGRGHRADRDDDRRSHAVRAPARPAGLRRPQGDGSRKRDRRLRQPFVEDLGVTRSARTVAVSTG